MLKSKTFWFSYLSNQLKLLVKILDKITNYTAGIYFIHYLIGKGYAMKIILGNKIENIFGCLIIYLISYISCFFLDKLIGNTNLKHLIK